MNRTGFLANDRDLIEPINCRSWFITGASSGIGYEMARLLLERGEKVAGVARDIAPLQNLKAEHGERLWTAPMDLTDRAAISEVVDRAFTDLGRIDVIVSNAGYGLLGPAEGFTDAQIDHQIATNMVGPIQLVRMALPHLREQGGGRVLQVSSLSGQAAHAGSSIYNASKWGVEGFMEAMAHELAPFGIEVTIVEPGGVQTSFRRAARQHQGRLLPAYEGTAAGSSHRGLEDTARKVRGDPVRMAQVMIDSVDQTPAPRRLVLGSDAYTVISTALAERLADIEVQKESAASTDFDPA